MVRKLFCLLTFGFLVGTGSLAQAQNDVIYQADDQPVPCRIVSLEKDVVKYKKLSNLTGPSYSARKQSLLMAFRQNGAYIVFGGPEGDFTNAASVDDFMSETPVLPHDLLITRTSEVITAEVNRERSDDDLLHYRVTGGEQMLDQVSPREQITAILFQDGGHELYASPTEVAAVLRSLDAKIADVVPNAPTGATTDIVPEVAMNEEGDFTQVEFEEYKNKALLKTDELGTYLGTIADPKVSAERSNKAIELAVGLFVNEDARFEVSNAYTGEKIKYKVPTYLRKLKLLGEQYSDVKITWTDISYVSNLRKGPDGNYYGVITVQQIFEGFAEGKVVYRDVTRKNVEVVLKTYQKVYDGESQEEWDVFLANVGVVETKKG